MGLKDFSILSRNIKLSSPWVILFNKLVAIIGVDKTLEFELIDDDTNSKIIKITAKALWKAEALACILISEYQFANIIVSIQIFYKDCTNPIVAPNLPEGMPANIAGLIVINRALKDNPYFYLAFPPSILEKKKNIHEDDDINRADDERIQEIRESKNYFNILPWEASIVLVFRRLVVQYYTDNIGDFFLNENQVSSVAFKEIMNEVLFETCSLTFTVNPDIGAEF